MDAELDKRDLENINFSLNDRDASVFIIEGEDMDDFKEREKKAKKKENKKTKITGTLK